MATNYVIGWKFEKTSIFKKTLINLGKKGRAYYINPWAFWKKKKNQ